MKDKQQSNKKSQTFDYKIYDIHHLPHTTEQIKQPKNNAKTPAIININKSVDINEAKEDNKDINKLLIKDTRAAERARVYLPSNHAPHTMERMTLIPNNASEQPIPMAKKGRTVSPVSHVNTVAIVPGVSPLPNKVVVN